jgi:short-subunit dehydrogenase
MAFGFRDRKAWERQLKRCRDAGLRGNGPPLRTGASSVTYLNAPDGFTVELLHTEPWFDAAIGFTPRAAPRLAPFAGRNPSVTRRERAFKKAVVTGGAGRICGELASLCAADGTALVLVDRDAEGLERIAEPLRAQVDVSCVPVDFADLDALDAVANSIAQQHTDIDLLIAGAGVDRAQSLLNFDWRQARDDFNINTLANLVLLEQLLPAMTRRGGGHVTTIASLAALIGTPYEGVYSATKAALGRLMESARGELRDTGVTFTTAYPGFIDTPLMWANAYKHPYVVPLREAAERIYAATLRRKATVHFPLRERLRIAGGSLLPTRLRDRIAKDAMNPQVAAQLSGDGESDSA